MTQISTFELARRQSDWLAARQSVIANNIAHASSPGFRAVDLKPFDAVVESSGLAMATTSSLHLAATGNAARTNQTMTLKALETSHSGNSVSIDQQLLMATDVRQSYALNAAVVKSLHRMILAAAKA